MYGFTGFRSGTSYTYDAGGNLLSETDAEGNTTQYVYDALNRLTKITDSIGGVTERSYDDRGNLIYLKDPKSGITRYEYDRNDRMVKRIRPMGEETIYGYDAAGNRTTVLDAKSQKITYEYDPLNRLIKARYFSKDDHENPVKIVEFAYDKLGNLISYNDGKTTATYTYDDLERKTGETVNYGPFSLSYSYAYYANDLKKSFTAPNGITYDYTYDTGNRLSSIGIPGRGHITYNTYQWNSPTKITLPGGTISEYSYDPLMQVKSISMKDPAQNTFMAYNYQYSPAGNISAKDTEHGNYAYQYDQLYRLIKAVNPTLDNEAYTYDPLGNRLSSAGVSGEWTYNANNELLNYETVAFTYDEKGNVVQKAQGPETVKYIYDVEDRLVRIESGDGSVIAEYYYDPFGRRLWKNVGRVKTYFFYSDEGLVGEYDASGNVIRTYGYAPDSVWTTTPLYQMESGVYYWYQNDHLGTPQKIIDSSGRVIWTGAYESFGKIQIFNNEITNNLRFPGQYHDAETGLYYNWNRYYDPGTGRYLSIDPFNQGVNLYSYVFGNPTMLMDPEGLCVAKGALKAGAVALVGVGIVALLPAAVVSSPVVVTIGTVAAIAGSAYLGVSTGEVIMGETITGRKLGLEERLERGGANLVGWIALGIAATKEPYWRYTGPSSKPTYGPDGRVLNKTWLTKGYKQPYSISEAGGKLQIPNEVTSVEKVKVPFWKYVAGPKAAVKHPEWGPGGGAEYRVGGFGVE